MARKFNGEIAVDIRDSTPDWEPFLPPKAPDGAPNVLFLAWDDLGYATMDLFGGPVDCPNMRKLADRGVKLANFHTTALCSPTRASLLTGRNATSNGMATIAEFASGFPGISTRIPFENGFISEVLAEQGYNTYCVGKWHLTPGEECNLAAYKGRWPLGRGFERFYGWLGGETNNWYPDLVHDNHQVDAPGRPEDGYHVADDLADTAIRFIRDAKVIDPDKPFFMYLAPQAGHAPHQAPVEWIDKYKGKFDEGYEAIRAGILAKQIELGLLPEGTELSEINPHGEPGRTGPDGQAWPQLDTVRPWDSLSADEQRLFAAHGRGVRRLHLVLGRPGRSGARLPGGVGTARQHADRRHLGQRRQWRGRAERRVQRVALLQRAGERPGRHPRTHRPARLRRVVQPLQHRLGVGARHAVPVLEALGGSRGWCRRHGVHLLARRGSPRTRPRASSTSTRSTSCRRCTTCSASARRRPSRVTCRARSRARASLPRSPTRTRPASGRSSTRCSVSARSTTTAGSRRPSTRRCRDGASSSRTSGSSSTSRPTARRRRTSRPTTPPR